MSLRTDRAMLVRSVLEGVALNVRWLYGYYAKFLGQKSPRHPDLLGGGAQSDLWCGILASTLNVRMEQVAEPLHAQLRGVALWTRVCLGELTVHEAARLVPVAGIFEPEPREVRTYNELFDDFRHAHSAVKGLYRRFNGDER